MVVGKSNTEVVGGFFVVIVVLDELELFIVVDELVAVLVVDELAVVLVVDELAVVIVVDEFTIVDNPPGVELFVNRMVAFKVVNV